MTTTIIYPELATKKNQGTIRQMLSKKILRKEIFVFKEHPQHPNTVHMTELVGGADLECEFQVQNNDEF